MQSKFRQNTVAALSKMRLINGLRWTKNKSIVTGRKVKKRANAISKPTISIIKSATWKRRFHFHGIRQSVDIHKEEFGSGTGAWTIHPDKLDTNSVILSFGAGTNITFDLDVSERTGARVDIFDPTPASVEWLRSQSLPENIVFHDYGIGTHDGTETFYPPRRPKSAHFSPVHRYKDSTNSEPVECPVCKISTILRKLDYQRIDLLKMDIEGGEYVVLDDILTSGIEIDQLVLEFHHMHATIPFKQTVDAVMKLKKSGFDIFNISKKATEFSFVRGRQNTITIGDANRDRGSTAT